MELNVKYALHSNGSIVAQIDRDNEWGFSLITDSGNEFPGGFGLGNGTWTVLSSTDKRITLKLRRAVDLWRDDVEVGQ